jgi:hypothetical protein
MLTVRQRFKTPVTKQISARIIFDEMRYPMTLLVHYMDIVNRVLTPLSINRYRLFKS